MPDAGESASPSSQLPPTTSEYSAATHLWLEQHRVPPLDHVAGGCIDCAGAIGPCTHAWAAPKSSVLLSSAARAHAALCRSASAGLGKRHSQGRKPKIVWTRARSATSPGGTRVSPAGSRLVVAVMFLTYAAAMLVRESESAASQRVQVLVGEALSSKTPSTRNLPALHALAF